jgi:hypothetical protein
MHSQVSTCLSCNFSGTCTHVKYVNVEGVAVTVPNNLGCCTVWQVFCVDFIMEVTVLWDMTVDSCWCVTEYCCCHMLWSKNTAVFCSWGCENVRCKTLIIYFEVIYTLCTGYKSSLLLPTLTHFSNTDNLCFSLTCCGAFWCTIIQDYYRLMRNTVVCVIVISLLHLHTLYISFCWYA